MTIGGIDSRRGPPENTKKPDKVETVLSPEEYEIFKDQIRKSTFVLRRIIAYADKINAWSFETLSMNDRKELPLLDPPLNIY